MTRAPVSLGRLTGCFVAIRALPSLPALLVLPALLSAGCFFKHTTTVTVRDAMEVQVTEQRDDGTAVVVAERGGPSGLAPVSFRPYGEARRKCHELVPASKRPIRPICGVKLRGTLVRRT